MWGPQVFVLLAEHWGIPPALQRIWWQAVERARGDAAVAWRDKLCTAVPRELAARRQWLVDTCLPDEVLKIVEALALEGCLTRSKASRIEECLLQRLDRQGAWCAPAPRGEGRGRNDAAQ